MSTELDLTPLRDLYPFDSHFWERDGLRLHYLDEGSGDPVVMVHGNPTWSFYWRELVKALSPEYRVIVPDHMGCGLSDKPDDKKYGYHLKDRVDDLEGLLDSLGIEENVTLVAHDWGGMISLAYAMRRPERIKRLVMLNTSAFMLPEGKSLPMRLALIRFIRPFASVAVRGFNVFSWAATFMATKKGLPTKVKEGLVAPYNSWKNRLAVLRFVQDIPIVPGDPSYEIVKDVQENLARLQHLPLMVGWGEHDFVFDMEFLAEWKRRWPDAEYHQYPDAGHYVMEDAAEELIPAIQDFLKRNTLTPTPA
jgi:haloalkane dehalogenase